ncbi:MAG: CUAEP/CCAEP-tail radical SAM (seleno)protein [Nitrospirota bacterium]
MKNHGDILLLSCYELGHQPLGVAWPMGFLEAAGYHPVAQDLAVERLDPDLVRRAALIGVCVPMHTALRLGVRAAARVRELNPRARIAFFGLYASLNAKTLLDSAADFVVGGEYERALVDLVSALAAGKADHVPGVSTKSRIDAPVLTRIAFEAVGRSGLPPLDRYAKLAINGEERVVGYTEASRGCKHICRHCPIPPVYKGAFFPVPLDTVLDDVARLVRAGARHITFGDPDFLNGPSHARRVAAALHQRFPELTFDFTAKVEHLLKHASLLTEFAACGAVFVVSAVESFSDAVLKHLVKGHTRIDAINAIRIVRDAGLALRPSLVPFTPWATLQDYVELFDIVAAEDLVDAVDPVQLTIRLLVPPGSLLESDPGMTPYLDGLDASAFTHRWRHPDPRMDRLHAEATRLVEQATAGGEDPAVTFSKLRELALATRDSRKPLPVDVRPNPSRHRPPRLTEPWFCCAEPTDVQLRTAL